MVTRMAASVALLSVALGPAHCLENNVTPGNPPVVLIASEIDKDGSLVLVQYKTIFIQPTESFGGGPIYNERSLKKIAITGVKIYDGNGKEMTVASARKLLAGNETPILASSHGQQLGPFYRKMFKDDILLFAFPRESPTWKSIEAPELPVKP